MTSQQIDNRAKIEGDLIEAIVQKVLDRLDTEFRERALRVRAAKLAELRAFEDTHGLRHAVSSQREIVGGTKPSDKIIPKVRE